MTEHDGGTPPADPLSGRPPSPSTAADDAFDAPAVPSKRSNRTRVAAVAVAGAFALLVATVAFTGGGNGSSGDDVVPAAPGSGLVGGDELDEVTLGVDCSAWDAVAAPPPPASTDATLPGDDGGLRHDVLPNGLESYVRSNDNPGENAYLVLAVDAGSVDETEETRGLAHYLEHMLFNGTELFSENELISRLAALGVEFGDDLNAYTSFEETVYFLEVDSSSRDVDRGLEILAQWARSATLDPVAVENERGVVLEELRTRQGPDGRFVDRLLDLAVVDTSFDGRRPIGTAETISTITPDDLREFYDTWYRPDNMAIVAIGDFDVDDIERRIADTFGPLTAADGVDAPVETELDRDGPRRPQLAVYVDDELGSTSVEIMFTRPEGPAGTVETVLAGLRREVALAALDQRFADDANLARVPFYDSVASDFAIAEGIETSFISLDADPEDLTATLLAGLEEIVRVRRDGFTEDEVDRAIAGARAARRAVVDVGDTTQDAAFADIYTDDFLHDGGLAPPADRAQFELELLDRLTSADIRAEFHAVTACAAIAVHVGAPRAYSDDVPTDDEVAAAIEAAVDAEPRDAPSASATDVMAQPAPMAPVEVDVVTIYPAWPAERRVYPNGVTVIINATPIVGGNVVVRGQSPGGLAVVPDDLLVQARAANAVVDGSGAGPLDPVALDRLLADKNVSVSQQIGPSWESVSASSATTDLETALAIIHQRMVAPRIDPGPLADFVGRRRLPAEDPSRSADVAFAAAHDRAFWRGAPRYVSQFSTDDLDGLSPDSMVAVLADRFADSADFVFAIVGDLDQGVARDLADRYLGTLPGTGRVEEPPPTRPAPVEEIVVETVRAGVDQQARLRVTYDVPGSFSPEGREEHAVMAAVLENHLRERIREELGATYTPSVSVEARLSPDEGYSTEIEIQSDPDRIDEVSEEIQAALTRLRADGPSNDELREAREPLLRNTERINNPQLADAWLFLDLTGPRDVFDLEVAGADRLEAVRATDLDEIFSRLMPSGRYVEIRQLPAGTVSPEE